MRFGQNGGQTNNSQKGQKGGQTNNSPAYIYIQRERGFHASLNSQEVARILGNWGIHSERERIKKRKNFTQSATTHQPFWRGWCQSVPLLQLLAARLLFVLFGEPFISEKKRGGKLRGGEKHTMKPLPKNGFGPPPLLMIRFPPTWVIHIATRRPAHNTPIHMDLVAFLKKTIQEIHVDRRVVGWSAGRHVDHPRGGKFRHGLLEKPLNYGYIKSCFQNL